MAAPIRIVSADDIGRGSADPPEIRLPDPGYLFVRRAQRLRALAERGRAGDEFLRLIAGIADAQHAALVAHPDVADPPGEHLKRAREHGLPPLGTEAERDPAWRAALQSIVAQVEQAVPAATRPVVQRLQGAPPESLETAAADLLGWNFPNVDPVAAPFLAAALQVHWVHRAARLGTAAFARLDVSNVCPVCGSPALASVIRADGPVPGVRYLHCALCDAEWLLGRGQCSACDSREKVFYLHPEGSGTDVDEVVKAEVCDVCKTYLKIFSAERDPLVDPIADDLATLALDIRLDETGYERGGPNLFFIPGRI